MAYIKYFTKEKLDKISEENIALYDKYLKSCIVKNKDVKQTTYKVYENYMYQFLGFLAERYENLGLYSEVFIEDCVDILEDYMMFLQEELLNNKKVINTKLSAISSFYHWSVKRKYLQYHPFDGKLQRMQNAQEEKIRNSYFLSREQLEEIRKGLATSKFDIQDDILFSILEYSANRIGAVSKLVLSKYNEEEGMFEGIREKRGKIVEIPVSEHTKELIAEWKEMRKEEYDKLECDGLFIAKKDGVWHQMATKSLQERVKKMGKIIGIDDFYCHAVRKSVSSLVYAESGDITLSQELLNHSDPGVTLRHYIRPKSKKEILDKINKMREKNDTTS